MSKITLVILTLGLAGAALADHSNHYHEPEIYAQEPYAVEDTYVTHDHEHQYLGGYREENGLRPVVAGIFGLLVLGVILIGGLGLARTFAQRQGVFNNSDLLTRVTEAEADLARICNYLESNSELTTTRASLLLDASADPNDAFRLEIVRIINALNTGAVANLCTNNKKK